MLSKRLTLNRQTNNSTHALVNYESDKWRSHKSFLLTTFRRLLTEICCHLHACAGLCAVAAAIYYVIFYTSIGKGRSRSGRARHHEQLTHTIDGGGGGGLNGDRGAASTHIFMFKKS